MHASERTPARSFSSVGIVQVEQIHMSASITYLYISMADTLCLIYINRVYFSNDVCFDVTGFKSSPLVVVEFAEELYECAEL